MRKEACHPQGNPLRKGLNAFSAQTLQTTKVEGIYRGMKGETADKQDFIQEHCPSEMKERHKLSQDREMLRDHHHQACPHKDG